MKKIFNLTLLSSALTMLFGLSAGAVFSSNTAMFDKETLVRRNAPSGSSFNFSDNFNSYTAYDSSAFRTKWTNGFLYNDGTQFNPVSCNADKFSITDDPINSGHGKVLKMDTYTTGESYSWVSIKDLVTRKFTLEFDCLYPHQPWADSNPTNPPWFGVMVRRDREDRFTNTNGAMLIFSMWDDNKIEYRPMESAAGAEPILMVPEGTFVRNFSPITNSWHHYKIVSDGAGSVYTFSAYIDNQLIGTTSDTAEFFQDAGYIAFINCVGINYFDNVTVVVNDSAPDIYPPVIDTNSRNNIYYLESGNDVVLNINYNGYDVESLTMTKNSSGQSVSTLVANSNYTVGTNTLTLKTSYLDTLASGSISYEYRLKTSGSDLTFADFKLMIRPALDKPSVEQSSYTYDNDDLSININLGNAQFVALKKGDSTLVQGGDYFRSGNTIMILSDYLNNLGNGDHTFTLVSQGGSTTFNVHIEGSAPVIYPPSIAPSSMIYRKGDEVDCSFNLTLQAQPLTSILMDGLALPATGYVYSNMVLTLKSAYLESLANGSHSLTISTSAGSASSTLFIKSNGGSSSEPEIISTSLEYTLNSNTPLLVQCDFKGIAVSNLTCGFETLSYNDDYQISDNYLILMPSYLNRLASGDVLFSLTTSSEVDSALFSVTIKAQSGTTPLAPEALEVAKTYELHSLTNVTFSLDLHNQPITRVAMFGASDLVYGESYLYSQSNIIILSSFLENLDEGDYNLFVYTAGGRTSISINVIASSRVLPQFHDLSLTYYRGTIVNLEYYVKFNGLKAQSILDHNGQALVYGQDYILGYNDDPTSFYGDKIVLNNSYVSKFADGEYSLILKTEIGDVNFKFIVMSKEAEGGAPSADKTRYSYELSSNNSVEIQIDLKGLAITSFVDAEGNELNRGEDYIVAGEGVVVYASYLEKYSKGRYSFTIATRDGVQDISIKIKNSTKVEVHDYSALATTMIFVSVGVFVAGVVGIRIFLKRRKI